MIPFFFGLAVEVFAAGVTLVPADGNYYVQAVGWRANADGVRVLFVTYPDIRESRARQACNANYYVVDLVPGLGGAEHQLVAGDICGHALDKSGGLLGNGDVVITPGKRIEVWRPGQGRRYELSLSDVQGLSVDGREVDGTGVHADVSDSGIVVVRGLPIDPRARDVTSAALVGLSASGATLWQATLAEPGVLLGPMDVWATADGGALLHVSASALARGSSIPGRDAPAGTLIIGENRLYRVSSQGVVSSPLVIATALMPDLSQPATVPDPVADPDGFRAALEQQQAAHQLEGFTAGQVLGQANPDGSVDVFMGRGTREGRWIRVAADGTMADDHELTQLMEEEGVSRWQDATVSTDRNLLLLSALSTRAGGLAQSAVSRIDPSRGTISTRLAPLSPLGLAEARQAGDATVQYLTHNPSQQPLMLAMIGTLPVAISMVVVNRQQALQIDEIDDRLDLYTEARDRRAAEQAREDERRQRKAQREAFRRQMAPVEEALEAFSDGAPVAAEEAQPSEKAGPAANCDCSCASLTQSMNRMNQASTVAPSSLDFEEMQQIGECLGSCQSELLACMQQQN